MPERSHILIDAGRTTVNLELDGRAILCRRDDRTMVRHPIQRLDRVTLRGPVSIHSTLLAYLSGAGVPVVCVAADGSIAAMIPPRHRPGGNLCRLLDGYAPDQLRDITQDWQRAELSRHARALQFADPATAARAGWSGVELLLRAILPTMGRTPATRIVNESASFCRLLSMRALSDAAISHRWLGCGSSFDPNLNETFALIALWRLLRFAVLPRFRASISTALSADELSWGKAVARLAETSRQPLYAALRRDLHRYHLHLIDLQRNDLWHG